MRSKVDRRIISLREPVGKKLGDSPRAIGGYRIQSEILDQSKPPNYVLIDKKSVTVPARSGDQERGKLRAKESRRILDRLGEYLEGPVAKSVLPASKLGGGFQLHSQPLGSIECVRQ